MVNMGPYCKRNFCLLFIQRLQTFFLNFATLFYVVNVLYLSPNIDARQYITERQRRRLYTIMMAGKMLVYTTMLLYSIVTARAGLRRVRGVRPNRAADFRGTPPFWIGFHFFHS